jgi:hypothetical protein
MRDRPKGDELLACARSVLREQVLPVLPPEHKHGLLMALNAMSIAERQLQYGEAPERAEMAALETLLGQTATDLAAANRLLALSLRAGAGDPGREQRDALLAHLRTVGRQRVLESNPKALPATAR